MNKTERKIKQLLGECVDIGYELTQENEIIVLLGRLLKAGLKFEPIIARLKPFDCCFKSNADKGNYVLATQEDNVYAIFRPDKMRIQFYKLDNSEQEFNFIVRIQLKPIKQLLGEVEKDGGVRYEVVHKATAFAQHQIKKATSGGFKIAYTAGYGDTVYRLLSGELELIIGE